MGSRRCDSNRSESHRPFRRGWASEEQTVGNDWRNERFPLTAIRQKAQIDRLRAFVDRLASRGYLSLQLDSVVLAGEYHLTAPPAGLTRGLLSLVEAGIR